MRIILLFDNYNKIVLLSDNYLTGEKFNKIRKSKTIYILRSN